MFVYQLIMMKISFKMDQIPFPWIEKILFLQTILFLLFLFLYSFNYSFTREQYLTLPVPIPDEEGINKENQQWKDSTMLREEDYQSKEQSFENIMGTIIVYLNRGMGGGMNFLPNSQKGGGAWQKK